jgi:molybdopterin synthase catalytic subunit
MPELSSLVTVQIINGPLPPAPTAWRVDGAGAILLFEGTIRPSEGDAPISALDYEAYRPMAEKQLERLAGEMISRHGVLAIHVEHSQGTVPAGDCSFRLQIASAHRQEGIRAMEEFIDRMKQDVPIWKKPVYAAQEPAR